ncbi:MAG: hypothetical protein JW725_04290 [Candidatus Babeliaceae bacterium]|nr:hypothetical protein [Candidatus Babeliaceae bacterium]
MKFFRALFVAAIILFFGSQLHALVLHGIKNNFDQPVRLISVEFFNGKDQLPHCFSWPPAAGGKMQHADTPRWISEYKACPTCETVYMLGKIFNEITVQPGEKKYINAPIPKAESHLGTLFVADRCGAQVASSLFNPKTFTLWTRILINVGDRVYHLYYDRNLLTVWEARKTGTTIPQVPHMIKKVDGTLETRYTPHGVPAQPAFGETLYRIFTESVALTDGVVYVTVNKDKSLSFFGKGVLPNLREEFE